MIRAAVILLFLLPPMLAHASKPEASSGEAELRTECPASLVEEFAKKSGDKIPSCSVNEFRPIGALGGREYFYALYRILSGNNELDELREQDRRPLNNTAVAIFRKIGAELVPVWTAVGSGLLASDWFEDPRILHVTEGPVLFIPYRFAGTGAGNADIYLMERSGRWERLDTESWLKDLETKLPAGAGIWKGVVLDLERMSVESSVWKKNDANCCPTGGKVHVDFALRDLRLDIANIVYPAGEADVSEASEGS